MRIYSILRDFNRAFVALLNTSDPPASSVPGKRLVYRFGDAPSGMPRKYIIEGCANGGPVESQGLCGR